MRLFKLVPFAFAIALWLAACTAPAPQAPAEAPPATATDMPAPASDAPAEAAPAPVPPASAKRSPGQENAPVLAYRAFGTEPFWSVRVDGDTLVFSTPENQPGQTLRGKRVPSLRGVSYQGKDGEVDFNLDIQDGECNDGMSDNEYTLESTFVYGGTTYRGCAEAAK